MRWSLRVADMVALDTAWLKANPLPDHHDNIDKNGRGRVLLVGGCRRVPGGMLLTAEAAFRAGAGKVTIATIASAAIPMGIAFPACAVVALPETQCGEIAPESADLLIAELALHDAIVFGPAMIDEDVVAELLAALLPALPDDLFLLLDAAALRAAAAHAEAIAARGDRTILTPHTGELAALPSATARLRSQRWCPIRRIALPARRALNSSSLHAKSAASEGASRPLRTAKSGSPMRANRFHGQHNWQSSQP